MNSFDSAVHSWMMAHQHPLLRSVSGNVSHYGSVAPMCWLALIGAVAFLIRRKQAAAVSMSLAPALAIPAYSAGKNLLIRARPPGAAALGETTDSFPSAHATTATAVCCVLAYVCWREGILPGWVALIVAVAPPLAIGASRLYLDVHWTTDVIAGWAIGVVVAVLAGLAYRRAKV